MLFSVHLILELLPKEEREDTYLTTSSILLYLPSSCHNPLFPEGTDLFIVSYSLILNSVAKLSGLSFEKLRD